MQHIRERLQFRLLPYIDDFVADPFPDGRGLHKGGEGVSYPAFEAWNRAKHQKMMLEVHGILQDAHIHGLYDALCVGQEGRKGAESH